MARLRKEKGKLSKATTQQKQESNKTSSSVSKSHVLAMGGSQADIDLLKGVDKSAVSGGENNDPTLSNDVSKFLKGLNLKDGQPHPKGKGKEKEKSLAEKPSTKKSQPDKPPKPSKKEKAKAKTSSTGHAPASNDQAESSMRSDEPKIKLPAKVSLNPKSHFVFSPTSQWYNALPPIGPLPQNTPSITPTQLSSLSTKAAQLHEADIRTFLTSSTSSSEASFMTKIIQSGTLSDRLSALTLLVQSSPLHNVKALESLKGMAERGKGKGGREESLKALRCIVDWWVGGGAPSRKLRYFRDQPLLHPSVTDEYLLAWYFEDWLKKYFFSILQILETLSLDPLPYVRTQSITLIFTLLRDKPEQEQNLLRLLVNKLGDTEKGLCSRASYHLLQLLQTHPSMKPVVVREIVALVLRPPAPATNTTITASTSIGVEKGKHIRFADAEPSKPKPREQKPGTTPEKRAGNAHARYYATVTFNQIVLASGDKEVALKLLDVYFEMFKELLGEGVDVEEETAVTTESTEELKTDKSGRILDGGKGKGKAKGRQGEIKGAAGFTEVEDANSKLVSAILTGVNRALPFAKVDAGDAGINKHIDTLFLITHKSTFNISLQALMLIQQITAALSSSSSVTPPSTSSKSTAKSIIDRYYRTLYASLHDTRLAGSSKQAMYLNLFFKSVKTDAGQTEGDERVKALVKRFVQVLGSGGGGATEFVAGGLYLLGELFSTIPGLRTMITRPAEAGEEVYDARKREPQFAHASTSPLWELTPLLNHYHPAVSLHARQLLSSQPLTASADLSQNTLSHFLDRFVYKNPKKVKVAKGADGEASASTLAPGAKGASAMQPAASALEGVKLIRGEMPGGREVMVNDPAFLRKRRGEVPVDQLFFHDYFTRKQEKERAMARGKKEDEEDDDGEEDVEEEHQGADESEEDADAGEKLAGSDWDEDADSALEEDEIWKAMKASMPKAGDEDLMEDSEDESEEDEDEVPDFGDDSDLAIEDDDDDDGDEEEAKGDSDDEDGMSLVEGSDNEDLISLDGDIPDGLIEYGSDDEEDDNVGVLIPHVDLEEEWDGIRGSKNDKKRKRDEAGKGGKRKKLRSLPTFASYEDYAKLIEDGPEDDI